MNDNSNTDMLQRKLFILISTFLVIATIAIYWPVLGNDFVDYDDQKYVTANINVQKGITLESLTWAFTSFNASNWHPITWISHMVDCELYNLNPKGHHLTNLLLHVASSLLLLLVLVLMTGAIWQSGFVAALFALHPIHVESVAWVAERKDVLSTFFMMLTVWAYIRYVDKKEVKRYLLIVLFFVLGLMSKPMLVTLPFILLMLDFWPLGRLNFVHGTRSAVTVQYTDESSNIFRLVWEKVPLFALAVVSSVATVIAQESGGAVQSLQRYSLKTRIINAFVAYIEYMVNMFWPVKLAVLYPHPGNSLPLWKGVVAALVLVFITTMVIWKVRKVPYLAVGWFWYIVTLIPVIGIVQVGLQAMADRYTYITLIGLFVVITWGANDLLSKLPHRKIVLGTLTAILLPILMALTWKQVQYWENSITLFGYTLKHTSNNYVAHNNLGTSLHIQGRTEDALEHYSKTLQIKPDHAMALYNVGNIIIEQGRTDEAIEHYLKALQVEPGYAFVHNNLGLALVKQDRIEEAIEHYLKALRIKPDYAMAHNNLGLALEKQGRVEEAIEHYIKALRIKPNYSMVHNNLGLALSKQGRTKEAIEHYLKALRIKPDDTLVHKNLAILLIRIGDINGAIVHLLKVSRINPDDSMAHNNLGSLLIRKGDMKGAIVHFQKALSIDPENMEIKNNLNKALMMQQH